MPEAHCVGSWVSSGWSYERCLVELKGSVQKQASPSPRSCPRRTCSGSWISPGWSYKRCLVELKGSVQEQASPSPRRSPRRTCSGSWTSPGWSYVRCLVELIFSCDSSSICDNVRRSVGLMVCNEFQSSTEHNAQNESIEYNG